ncbi:MAG: hypothetical protein DIJKHBIC_00462 [Thermoanaerobaculia bacterium]|nr:hypothetical protein [Thermoanaerobaculia bacterium]
MSTRTSPDSIRRTSSFNMRPDSVLRLLLAGLLVLLPARGLLAGSPAGRTAYVEGQNAFIASDWSSVVSKMRIAIQDDPEEGLEKFKSPKGLNMVDYAPHLYLGLALEKLNQPEEAQKALRESRRQGAVLGRSGLKSMLERAQSRLEARLAPVPAAPQPTVVAVVRKDELPVIATPAGRPAPTTAAPTPTAARVAVLVPTLPPLVPVQPTAAVARPAATAAAGPDPSRDVLRSGIRLYLAGKYRESQSVLEPIHVKNPSARLFFAYSLASLYFALPQPDAALKDRALTEFTEARAAGATPLPAAQLPPKVRDLLGIR